MAKRLSLKQIAIDKDSTAIFVAVGLATFIVIFSLVASHALIKQMSYQSGVITKKEQALKNVKQSKTEVEKLKIAYAAFAEQPQNVLGGNPQGTGDKDGDNPRLILDALPSKYDFPALTTSLEKVFQQYQIANLQGTDDEVNQAAIQASGAPTLTEIPFIITLNASPQATKQILETYEKSIRPFKFDKVNLQSTDNEFRVTVEGKTYFQGTKKFDVQKTAGAQK